MSMWDRIGFAAMVALVGVLQLLAVRLLDPPVPARVTGEYFTRAQDERRQILDVVMQNATSVAAIQAALVQTNALLTTSQLETNSRRLLQIEACTCGAPNGARP